MAVSQPDESPERATGPAGEGEAPGTPGVFEVPWLASPTSGPNGSLSIASPSAAPTLPEDDQASHTPANLLGSLHTRESPDGFGELLAPALLRTCQGRLRDVRWFRTDWQRSGALTGYATYTDDHGIPQPVVVKLPVPPCERHWLVRLQPDAQGHAAELGPIVPRVFAHGEALNGYDLAWVVMERLPHGPLGPLWNGQEFDLLAQAVARFYAAARHVPRKGDPVQRDWEHLLDKARRHVQERSLLEPQRWKAALKKAHKKVREWSRLWHDRRTDGWVHGDLHLGNAMTRDEPPDGPALLFDFANTRVGHWLEDAVYFEHLFWRHPQRLNGRRLCSAIAHERKRHGLPPESDWPRLADAERALVAMSTPANLIHDGDPHHLGACLQVLEKAVR